MLLDKLLEQYRQRKNSKLQEDYTTGPWTPPNDTTYVGFFFEKDVNSFPDEVLEKYKKMKEEILAREKELREKYGEDWRNVAVFQAYRLAKKEAESQE